MRHDADLFCTEVGLVATGVSVRSVIRIVLTSLTVAGLLVVMVIPGAEADGG
ncbi:MAG: hypothetical protein OXF41_19580 [bacterium]|nr:hypothetical protein [bacterium]